MNKTVGKLPFYQAPASCGFPSPAADFAEQTLSLDELLIHRPAATFFARASGCSMEGAGIMDGATLVVDRSLTPRANDIVLALLDGDLLVKRISYSGNSVILSSEHPDYPAVTLAAEQQLDIWGVVTAVVNRYR